MNSREESGLRRRENESRVGMEVDKQKLQKAFEQSWTRETSSMPDEWSEGQTSRGQCVPTALVAQDYLGGDLQKLITVFNGEEESHYRNVLADGTIFDASCSQYPKGQDLQIANVALKGFDSIREKRLSEPETARRYILLKQRVARNFNATIGGMNTREELEQAIVERLPYFTQQPELDLPTMVRDNPDLLLPDHPVPRNIGKYALIPMTSLAGVAKQPGQLWATGDYTLPPDVQTHADGNVRMRPMLEGPAALGITVEKDGQRHLCAVGAIRITEEGALRIVQIQGSITDKKIGPQLGGFRFGNVFIEAWREIAGAMGITTIEVSDAAGRVVDTEGLDDEDAIYEERKNASFRRNYDGAAAHAGLAHVEGANVWRMPVAPQPKAIVSAEAIPEGQGLIGAVRRRLRTIADTSEYASDGGMMHLALAERAMILANRALDGGDLDWDYPTVYAGISREFQDAWQKVEEARVATHAALQSLRNFEKKI